MLPLIFSSTAALVVLIAAYGLHLVRDDGTSQLGLHVDIENKTQQVSAFVKLIDTLGIKTQKFLRKIYGATHLRSLDRRLKNAGNPEGLSLDLFIQREAGFITLSILLFAIFTLIGRPLLGIVFGIVFSG